MCEPTTMLMAAGLGAQVFGSYQQAQAQRAQASYNARVAENNAVTAEYQAQDAKRRGDEEAAAIRRNADMLKGSQRASMAAKGLDLAEGTAQELQDQTDFFSMVDQTTARNNAAKDAWAARVQGANFRSSAAASRATARSISPVGAGFTTLLSGAGTVADKWYTSSKPTTTTRQGVSDDAYWGVR